MIVLALACATPGTPTGIETCAACDGACTIESFSTGSRAHVEGEVEYAHYPPTSGDHASCWAEWTVHADAVPDENWVHNLEHGGVAFLYDCPGGCSAAVEAMAALHAELPEGRALVSPYADMVSSFAAVAWGARLLADCFEAETFRAFFDAHVGKGPEDVTSGPNAECM